MANIGDIFLGLFVDDKGLQADIVKKAGKAGDAAGKTLGAKLSNGFKGFGDHLKAGLGLGAGIAAFGLLDRAISGTIGIAGDAVQAFRDEEKSIAGLDAALRANVAGWDGNRDAIEEVIASRMRLGFADDEQRASLARLVSITKDHGKALDLQRTAMDLARLRGIDLAAASDIVGKVYGGNIGILSRYGIQLAKGTTATEALAEIQRRAAGQAEAYANINDGKLLASQIKVGEAMEKLGERILPLVVVGMEAVGEAATFLGDALAALDPVFEVVGDGFGFLLDIGGEFLDFVHGVPAEVKGMGTRTMEEILDGAPKVGAAADVMGDEIAEGIEAGRQAAIKIASVTPKDIADALRKGREEWRQAASQFAEDFENEVARSAEIAELEAFLASKALADGLKDGRPLVRASAEAARDAAAERLRLLVPDGRRAGSDGGRAYAGGLRTTTPAATSAGQAVAKSAGGGLRSYNQYAYSWGRGLGSLYAQGLRSTYGIISEAAAYAVRGAVGPMRPSSPPKEGPLHTIDEWGPGLMDIFAAGIRSGRSSLADAAAFAVGGMTPPSMSVPSWAVAPPRANVPSFGAGLGTVAQPAPVAGGDTNTVNVQGFLPARSSRDIVEELQRISRLRKLPDRRIAPLYPRRELQ